MTRPGRAAGPGPGDRPSRAREWRSGGALVLAASAGLSISSVAFYDIGLLVAPLHDEFGWSKAAITSGMAINSAVAILFSPFVGMRIDRLGPRRIAILGTAVYLAAFALLSTAGPSLVLWWGLWLLLASGSVCVQAMTWLTAVTSRFAASRGLAVALTLCGSTLTAILGPQLMGWAIAAFGWRRAIVLFAAIWGSVVLPLVLIFFHGAKDLERGRAGSIRPPPAAPADGDGFAPLRSPTYLKLLVAVMLSYCVVTGSVVHLPAMLVAGGIARSQVPGLISLIGLGALTGRIAAGFWLDRFEPRYFAAAMFAMPAIACTILLGTTLSHGRAIVAILAIGLATGAELEIATFLITLYFGTGRAGFLLGIVSGALMMVVGVAPFLFGLVFDRYGSFAPALLAALPASIAASLLILSIGRRTAVPDPFGTG